MPYQHWVIASVSALDADSLQLSLTKTLPRAECTHVVIHATQTLETLYAALIVHKKSLKKLLFIDRYLGAPVPETNALINMPGYRPRTLPLNKLPMLAWPECSRPKLFL
ncbi:MAG: hypothetical protein OSA11_10500 [Candidatus Nanopelagicales bacterium]|nr:hypothetical protein [Candidatus Nanopelagicales bacterium]